MGAVLWQSQGSFFFKIYFATFSIHNCPRNCECPKLAVNNTALHGNIHSTAPIKVKDFLKIMAQLCFFCIKFTFSKMSGFIAKWGWSYDLGLVMPIECQKHHYPLFLFLFKFSGTACLGTKWKNKKLNYWCKTMMLETCLWHGVGLLFTTNN